jgi:small subunit ribosomal protein S17
MGKELTGTISSVKMQKTVVVSVVRRTRHPLYGKIVKKTKRYKAHVEDMELAVGDTVVIQECRPLSKDKHFRVIRKVVK